MNAARSQSGEKAAESGLWVLAAVRPILRKLPHKLRPKAAQPTRGQRVETESACIGALAHLQLGRAYVLMGDTAKAKAAYQDFLTLWKDAGPDIPILKQARAEYAPLQ
jgi:hypothetical protein